MVYGTIIFEVGTWEPSLTPPSSLSPFPSHAPHSQGRGATNYQAGGPGGTGPTLWLMNTNGVTTFGEGGQQCFFSLTRECPELFCKKSIHWPVLWVFLPEGLTTSFPKATSLRALLFLSPSRHSQSDTWETRATPSEQPAHEKPTLTREEQTKGPLEKRAPKYAKQFPCEKRNTNGKNVRPDPSPP